jgi:hypothetical protein
MVQRLVSTHFFSGVKKPPTGGEKCTPLKYKDRHTFYTLELSTRAT